MYPVAASYAAKCHRNQTRKNKQRDPYINHPLSVASFLCNAGIEDEEILCAAVLHDVVEDTDGSLQHIEDTFGEGVALMVSQVTDDKSLKKSDIKRAQLLKVKDPSFTMGAAVIKLADKYDNLSNLKEDPPTTWSPETIKGYTYWSFAVVNSLKGVSTVIDELFKPLFEKLEVDVNISPQDLQVILDAYYIDCDKA